MKQSTCALLFIGAVTVFSPAVFSQSVETIPFRAFLSARNEATLPSDPTATGGVTIWLHLVRDASGQITSGSLDFGANYKFAAPKTLVASHIHKGDSTVGNGTIVVPAPFTRFDDPVGVGTLPVSQVQFSATDTNTAVMDTVNGLLANPEGFYFNIHTADAPAGAIRGQIQRADTVVLMGMMSPANETPPIQGSSASGVATVVGLRTLDRNFNLTSASVIFDVNYTGFPTDTTFTGFHVHFGALGIGGPVTLDSGISARNPVTASSSGAGNLHYEFDLDLTRAQAPDTVNSLFANPAGTYINLHTTVSPGGAIRAQLHRTDHTTFQATMTPSQEVATPPITISASTPAVIQVYTLRNPDGSIPAGVVMFDANPRLPANTTVTAMHIHDEVAGKNGNVTIDSRLPSIPLMIDAAATAGNIFRIATVSAAGALSSLNDLLQSPEKHYVNLHTTQFPGGFTRAQLGPAVPPAPAVSSIISSVSDATRTVAAPKGLMSIFGTRLAPTSANLDGFLQLDALPKSLNGASVTVGGTPAGLFLVSDQQAVIEVPAEAAAGDQPVVVTSAAGASKPFTLKVQPSAPDIFFDSVGGIVTRTDFTLVRPSAAAASGEVLVIFSTGNGQTTPPLTTARIPPSSPFFMAPQPSVTIGGQSATVIYSLASPGFPGLYQTAVRMPTGVAPGTAAVVMTIGTSASNSVNIAVR